MRIRVLVSIILLFSFIVCSQTALSYKNLESITPQQYTFTTTLTIEKSLTSGDKYILVFWTEKYATVNFYFCKDSEIIDMKKPTNGYSGEYNISETGRYFIIFENLRDKKVIVNYKDLIVVSSTKTSSQQYKYSLNQMYLVLTSLFALVVLYPIAKKLYLYCRLYSRADQEIAIEAIEEKKLIAYGSLKKIIIDKNTKTICKISYYAEKGI